MPNYEVDMLHNVPASLMNVISFPRALIHDRNDRLIDPGLLTFLLKLKFGDPGLVIEHSGFSPKRPGLMTPK